MSSAAQAVPRPSHHTSNAGTSFINPWPSASAPTWAELTQASFPLGWYKDGLRSHSKAREVKVVTPDWGRTSLKKKGLDRSNCVIGTWLGHASTLVGLPPLGEPDQKSVWLLFDPIFSLRAGPTQYSGFARTKRPPCQVGDLPGCDAVLISHNHYDHLDTASVKAILTKFPQAKYFVPLGIKQWLSSTGVPDDLIYELDWWQDRELSPSDFGQRATPTPSSTDQTLIKVSCVPAQHNSGRSGLDQGRTLWCAWVVERFLRPQHHPEASKTTRKGAIFHAGDTGYRKTARSEEICPAFTEIGDRFGPFDMSFVPIWRGGTLGFFSSLGLRLSHHDIPSTFHASPADAVAIHCDVKSQNTVAIHFGTFVGSDSETYEAMIEFAQACEDRSVAGLDAQEDAEHGRAGTLDIGESLAVKIV